MCSKRYDVKESSEAFAVSTTQSEIESGPQQTQLAWEQLSHSAPESTQQEIREQYEAMHMMGIMRGVVNMTGRSRYE